MSDCPRSVGAIVVARLDSVEQARNLLVVVEGLVASGADEVVFVEQRCAGEDVVQPTRWPSRARRELVVSRRAALERSRLVNRALASMTSDWIWVCDPNLVMPFRLVVDALRVSPNVAFCPIGEIETLGRAESAAWLAEGDREQTGTSRSAPFGKGTFAVERAVFLAMGGLSEAFVGSADDGFELVRRLKRFFSDFGAAAHRAVQLWTPRREVDRAARSDNKLLQNRLCDAIDADVAGYLDERFESSLSVDRPQLEALSRDRGRTAAFRASNPTPPPRLPRALRGEIWGVTALFNPAGYASKPDNFHVFRARLAEDGLRLLAVELAFGDAPFTLGRSDADLVLQLRGGDRLWQKERLLNVGVEALPTTCDKVVWLDADVLFERRDWVHRTAELLEDFVVVQPFSRSIRLRAGERSAKIDDFPVGSGEHEVLHSMAYGVAAKGHGCLDRYLEHGHCGYAWAARRDVVARHGLYDANVLGNGDLNVAHAMFGGARHLKTERLSDKARTHMVRWADAFYGDVRGSVGYVDGTVYHLFHGMKADRRYVDRLHALVEHDYDPSVDLAIAPSGAYLWASDKPGLHTICSDYFVQRREDG